MHIQPFNREYFVVVHALLTHARAAVQAMMVPLWLKRAVIRRVASARTKPWHVDCRSLSSSGTTHSTGCRTTSTATTSTLSTSTSTTHLGSKSSNQRSSSGRTELTWIPAGLLDILRLEYREDPQSRLGAAPGNDFVYLTDFIVKFPVGKYNVAQTFEPG